VKLVVNGQPMETSPRTSVRDVLVRLGRDPGGRGLAVSVNGEVVPRRQWDRKLLTDDDRVEVLAAVQGG
jgi:sulfur carrier protein